MIPSNGKKMEFFVSNMQIATTRKNKIRGNNSHCFHLHYFVQFMIISAVFAHLMKSPYCHIFYLRLQEVGFSNQVLDTSDITQKALVLICILIKYKSCYFIR